ncbi:hypothetical protein FM107_04595 [Sphingobacterium sp. JB170]|nr:hypothetical protein FM107_04595 [Sphingobacterium sp. JB170]
MRVKADTFRNNINYLVNWYIFLKFMGFCSVLRMFATN